MKNLKSFLLLFVVFSIGFLSSCDELKDAIKADFDYAGDAILLDIPEITSTSEVTIIGEEEYNFDLENIIKQNAPSFSISNIKEVKLHSVKVELTNGDADNNFQNLETLQVEVSATGLQNKIAAEVTNNPNTYSLSLNVPVVGGSIDLKNYFTKQQFTYRLKAKARKTTTKVLKAKITADYSFVVGL